VGAVLAELAEAQLERGERPAATGFEVEARLVGEGPVAVQLVVAESVGPTVAPEETARARKFREQAQPMRGLHKL
jgi:hypothetical protein